MDRKRLIWTCLFVGAAFIAEAQLILLQIPDSIRNNADAVILSDKGDYTIHSDDRATFTKKTRILVLNKKGNRWSEIVLGYDKLISVQKLKGAVYDQFGEPIRKLKNSDIKDYSAISGFSIYEDNRLKHADLRQTRFPYIVEFEYEQEFRMTYFVPNWRIVPSQDIGVLHSTFKITAPDDLLPRFKVLNIENRVTENKADGITSLEFSYQNIKPASYEVLQPNDVLPVIKTAPRKFNFEGYEGDFSSWESIGHWQNTLNKGLDDLSSSSKNEIDELLQGVTDDKEKVKRVYEYVQNKTRYVSIQLGIGGFKPFANSVVEETGYGDCKALSFYTQSLLKTAGIESHYTWVNAGRSARHKIDRDFPINQFNHIILCVPNKGDTLWLECTSQTNPFGYLGTFTSDRDVLLITEDGGKVVHTPKYEHHTNKQITRADVKLDKELNATINLKSNFSGLQYSWSGISDVHELSNEDQKKWIEKNFHLPGMGISDFDLSVNKKPIPESNAEITLNASKLFKRIGKRIFFNPNILNKSSYIPEKNEDRKFDMVIRYGYSDLDSISFEVPAGFRAEFLPEPTEIITEFGHYKNSLTMNGDQLIYTREVVIKSGRYNKAKYQSYRDFRSEIVKKDKMKIALLDQT